ncbi:uncharacterized protein PHALS_10048 [Plasmopara halstedii]|uniref:Uncharacterized protein n=1 Tax=Plasmopara halstedii TaxID=4781 RepID=A0A0P1AH53_PLAHL|nr:uncharacterized protein PHALS_10048 [Plasmopara halstedii]CEG39814.1 hypothetical protein PHALS_10048 [Plasmopara halstedii]|eukprot:XP_024576183.1 hypothetical protein PHALS_10048 [Plasmopara halstedii]
MLSADKEDDRSSNDTEDGDDMYMVEFRDDLESGDELFSRGGYVTPPVEIPEMYQRQDRFGGITVAGARVVFTYAGFKRQQVIRVKLQTIFEGE